MKRILLALVFVTFALLPAAAQAQGAAAGSNPVSAGLRASFDTICRYLTGSAAKMPEENYGFKPTPEVMSFGELVGHVADTHFFYCARVKGEKNPNDGNEIQKKTTKADIVKGLADSIAYCAPVYRDMTDAKALEPLPPPVAPGQTAADPLQAAQANLRDLESRLNPTHPDVIRAQRTVADLQAKAAAAAPAGQATAQPSQPPPPQPKLARLLGNLTHDWEHYGNLVTYLRIKGLVPPSSEPRR